MVQAGESPVASVVIPCRNEAGYIEACLRGVLAFEAPPGGFEVLVADGMSEDGSRDIVSRVAEEDSRVRLVDNPERTTPCGLNHGIRAARGAVIVRIDAHTNYAPDYLAACLQILRETGAENVGGPWIARGQGYLHRCIAAAFNAPFAAGGRAHLAEYEGEVDTVYLGCWPREVFDRIGLFDEQLVRNQDDELNFRLRRAGGRIWQSPRIRSWYSPRDSLGKLFRQYWQYGYWKVRVMQKHGAPASWRHLVPGGFAASLLALAAAATIFAPARLCLQAEVGAYLLAVLIASLLTSSRAGWALLPGLPIVFACYQLSYGLGFLIGVWDFIVRQRASGRFVSLTRG
jgi:succinoglycan biosynthesis protein ExoA